MNIHEETLEDIIIKQTLVLGGFHSPHLVHNRSTEPKINMNIKTKIKNIISKLNLIDTYQNPYPEIIKITPFEGSKKQSKELITPYKKFQNAEKYR